MMFSSFDFLFSHPFCFPLFPLSPFLLSSHLNSTRTVASRPSIQKPTSLVPSTSSISRWAHFEASLLSFSSCLVPSDAPYTVNQYIYQSPSFLQSPETATPSISIYHVRRAAALTSSSSSLPPQSSPPSPGTGSHSPVSHTSLKPIGRRSNKRPTMPLRA